MVHDVIATCPVCSGELTIARLHCRSCGTALEGEFGVGRFGRLDRDQMSLLESFLRSRGNLKEMERELDGFPEQTDGADPAAERRSILERLARKEISADDAAAALRDLETSS